MCVYIHQARCTWRDKNLAVNDGGVVYMYACDSTTRHAGENGLERSTNGQYHPTLGELTEESHAVLMAMDFTVLIPTRPLSLG